MSRPVTLDYFVEGMDCPSCVRKIEGALDRTSGVHFSRVNLTAQTLQVTLDETATPRASLERSLRSLGHEPRLLTPDAADVRPNPWYATHNGRQVLLTGGLLAAAFLASFVHPGASNAAYIAATVLGTLPLARRAFAGGRAGDWFGIHTLVTLAALGALLIGEAPEAAVVVFLFAVGELLEGLATTSARRGITALAQLTPRSARVVQGDRLLDVPAVTLRVGQVVRVLPSERVPADGTVVHGRSACDDSPVTGESLPVTKSVGSEVFAGSIATDGVLDVRVTRDAHDNTIARIRALVENAEANKAPVARFIDRFSRAYTPFVLLAACLAAVVPPLMFGGAWHEWIYKGVALLLIGCPCALVLSVPAAITSALAAGARRGLLVKGGDTLERLGTAKLVAFDKTGTLTLGRLAVSDVETDGSDADEVLRLAASVEANSTHPIAKAIVARAAHLNVSPATDGEVVPGVGVLGTVNGRRLAVTSPREGEALGAWQPRAETLEAQGRTVVVLREEGRVLGLIALRDEVRPEARDAVRALNALGVRSVMLTGDNRRAAASVAADLGVSVESELRPADKLAFVRAARGRGTVVMVGDGINDAPALAEADIGVAMGRGTDVALETASAALLREDVRGVPDLVRLSRATLAVIRQNVAFALGLKAFFLVTTLIGVTGLWPAVLSDTGATALVTLNALRLLRFGRSE